MDELLDAVRVTIGQTMHDKKIDDYLDENNSFRHRDPYKQLDILDKILSISYEDRAHFVLLPEFFLPRKLLYRFIKERSIRYKCIIMGGLEYGTDKNSRNKLVNEAFIVVPENLFRRTTGRNATIIKVPKLHPAPEEKDKLEGKGYEFKNGNRIYHFSSKKLGNFAILVCFDFLNLPVQAILQGQIQTLFVLTYNKDIPSFISIAETLLRLLLCNVVICNTGYYGGSAAFTPLREPSYERQVIQINGNRTQVGVTVQLPIKDIWKAQQGQNQIGNRKYFVVPPDYGELAIKTSNQNNTEDETLNEDRVHSIPL